MINDYERPTREECERDEQNRPPMRHDPAYLDMLRRSDPWNPENWRR
jgi:hypothetical protein